MKIKENNIQEEHQFVDQLKRMIDIFSKISDSKTREHLIEIVEIGRKFKLH